MVAPLVVALAAVIILALIPLTKIAATTKMRTFQATVIDKRKDTNVVYVGFFLPTAKHILITDRGLQAETTKEAYGEIKIGDKVTVAKYSDGVHSVDH